MYKTNSTTQISKISVFFTFLENLVENHKFYIFSQTYCATYILSKNYSVRLWNIKVINYYFLITSSAKIILWSEPTSSAT